MYWTPVFKQIPPDLPNDLYEVYADLEDVLDADTVCPGVLFWVAKQMQGLKPTVAGKAKNRIYVVSHYRNLALAAVGIKDSSFENLDRFFGKSYDLQQDTPIRKEHLCFLYTFSGKTMRRYNIAPFHMLEVVEAFSAENQVSFRGIRHKYRTAR